MQQEKKRSDDRRLHQPIRFCCFGQMMQDDFLERGCKGGPTHWLFGSTIIKVELSAEQAEPILEVQDAIIHVVARTSFYEQDLRMGQILGQPACNNATSSAASNDKIVIDVKI
jgi:hypothetical protein